MIPSRSWMVFVAIAAAVSAEPPAEAPSPRPAVEGLARFGWLADLVGSCWAGRFPDGKTQHSQCYTSQFGHFIRGTATLSGDHGGRPVDRFSGDSVFAWREPDKRIVYYIWGSDGNHGRHEAFYEGEELVFPVTSKTDPAVTTSRSVWRRTGTDTFEVRREKPEGTGWKADLTVIYRKAGPAR